MAGPAAKSLKATSEAKRMVFLGTGFGMTKSSWFPDMDDVGRGYALPAGLAPLERHKEGFSIIQNLTHQYSRNGHAGSTFWLTGANQYAVAGKSFHNTISVDQVAARHFGKHTRFTSLEFSSRDSNHPGAGHGPGLSLAWDEQGKPLSSLNSPNTVFHKLFSNPKISVQEQQQLLIERRSILDTVYADAKSMATKINHSDKEKLMEYVQSIRDIEVQIAKEDSWIGVPKKFPSEEIEEPSASLQGKDEIRIMYDLMVAAMQVDATRVMSYRLPADAFLRSLKISHTSHAVSHYSEHNDERKISSEVKDKAHSELLAEFFDKLKNTKEANGKSLFDSSVITFGSNLSSNHNLYNCPSLGAGGGANFAQGQNIVMKEEDTPLCNLWLSLLNGMGIHDEQFGDSTGVIEPLMG